MIFAEVKYNIMAIICSPSGYGKSYNDLLYSKIKKHGIYSYWKSYCKENGYYMFIICK